MRTPLFFAALVVLAATYVRGEEARPIVQILTTRGPSIGQIIEEDDTHIKLTNIKTGTDQTFSKDEVKTRKELTDDAASALVGLPSMMAWRIKQVIPGGEVKGSVVKLDEGTIYVSLGTNHGISAGQQLIAYRSSGEIKDPVTGDILGIQRRTVAQLEVIDVMGEKLCTAKTIEKANLEIGDFVVPAVARKAIVVLPLVDAGGNETNVGRQVAEELTTTLVNRGVSVVERSVLEKVLGELEIQQSSLVDPKTAQRVGRQIGAYAVLTGTVLPKEQTKSAELQHTTHVTGQWRRGQIDVDKKEALRVVGPKPVGAEVQARLIRVETGEILAAASQNIAGVTVRVVYPSGVYARGQSGVTPPSGNQSWRRTVQGFPLIAGVWRTWAKAQNVITISQNEGQFTANAVGRDHHFEEFGEISWKMNGTISKDGHISGTLTFTRFPPSPGFISTQQRTAVLDESGTIIRGVVVGIPSDKQKQAGQEGSSHEFAWRLTRTAEGYPLIAGVWREGAASIRHTVTISQNEGQFTAHGVCYIIKGQDMQPPYEWAMNGTISKDGNISATLRDTHVPLGWPKKCCQTGTGALDETGTIIHCIIIRRNNRGDELPRSEVTWNLERR